MIREKTEPHFFEGPQSVAHRNADQSEHNICVWSGGAELVTPVMSISAASQRKGSDREPVRLGPQSFTLVVAGNSQRRVAFLPWVPVRLNGLKPKDWADDPVTLGEHIKKVRTERGLLQREVAEALGVDSMSIVNWEKNRTKIGARFVPRIIQWLGYDPLPRATDLGSWITIERTRQGMARRSLARLLGWDEDTVRDYEQGRRAASGGRLVQLRSVLGQEPFQVSFCPSIAALASSPKI